MSSPITLSGFNNIDFSQVLTALMAQERIPVTRLETQHGLDRTASHCRPFLIAVHREQCSAPVRAVAAGTVVRVDNGQRQLPGALELDAQTLRRVAAAHDTRIRNFPAREFR